MEFHAVRGRTSARVHTPRRPKMKNNGGIGKWSPAHLQITRPRNKPRLGWWYLFFFSNPAEPSRRKISNRVNYSAVWRADGFQIFYSGRITVFFIPTPRCIFPLNNLPHSVHNNYSSPLASPLFQSPFSSLIERKIPLPIASLNWTRKIDSTSESYQLNLINSVDKCQ